MYTFEEAKADYIHLFFEAYSAHKQIVTDLFNIECEKQKLNIPRISLNIIKDILYNENENYYVSASDLLAPHTFDNTTLTFCIEIDRVGWGKDLCEYPEELPKYRKLEYIPFDCTFRVRKIQTAKELITLLHLIEHAYRYLSEIYILIPYKLLHVLHNVLHTIIYKYDFDTDSGHDYVILKDHM